MNFKLNVIFFLLALFIFSCSQKKSAIPVEESFTIDKDTQKPVVKPPAILKYGKPVAQPATIVKDIMSFLAYKDRNIRLYEEFIGLDTASNIIPKGTFLKFLSTGNYLPLKLISNDSKNYYKLSKLENSVDKDIKTTIMYWGLQEYDYYKLEGTELPDYNFVDMEGKVYDKVSTKGKIVVIKCWFIACAPCVKEMPVLNELSQKYLNQKDILFISLCWDPKNKVKSFLKKNPFIYSTVPDQYKFLTEKLALNGYPTHFVLDKDGKIIKKTMDYREMIYALEKLSLRH